MICRKSHSGEKTGDIWNKHWNKYTPLLFSSRSCAHQIHGCTLLSQQLKEKYGRIQGNASAVESLLFPSYLNTNRKKIVSCKNSTPSKLSTSLRPLHFSFELRSASLSTEAAACQLQLLRSWGQQPDRLSSPGWLTAKMFWTKTVCVFAPQEEVNSVCIYWFDDTVYKLKTHIQQDICVI